MDMVISRPHPTHAHTHTHTHTHKPIEKESESQTLRSSHHHPARSGGNGYIPPKTEDAGKEAPWRAKKQNIFSTPLPFPLANLDLVPTLGETS